MVKTASIHTVNLIQQQIGKNYDTHCDVEEPLRRHAGWKQPGTRGHRVCGSAHVTSLEQADLLRQEGAWELPPAGGGGWMTLACTRWLCRVLTAFSTWTVWRCDGSYARRWEWHMGWSAIGNEQLLHLLKFLSCWVANKSRFKQFKLTSISHRMNK